MRKRPVFSSWVRLLAASFATCAFLACSSITAPIATSARGGEVVASRKRSQTYVFAKDPSWTGPVQTIKAADPIGFGRSMQIAAAPALDGRHVVLMQAPSFDVLLPAKIRSGRLIYVSPNGFKVWSGGPEAWYSQVVLSSARRVIGKQIVETRRGFGLESPAGTFPLLAINGPINDEELHALVDSLMIEMGTESTGHRAVSHQALGIGASLDIRHLGIGP